MRVTTSLGDVHRALKYLAVDVAGKYKECVDRLVPVTKHAMAIRNAASIEYVEEHRA